ncbi:TonB-dependent receptor [Pacificimonas flava]|uniref:TonB-dependent receptor n=2 Tax=Pacificimonas TaxID=1960290 RepID=A0A219B8Q3_9SPHN|nr:MULTISPECIES: TonB-dependent receptor [Pacificimonas]MBZ6379134.1 TonB-dependent receptor [Pacificimonas aurantium]OWV34717.1 TonB-dependent receptor [Pacificimonas flava]
MRRQLARSASLIALSIFAVSAASASEIRGTVLDESGVRPLQGAEVTIPELGRSAFAERDGSFQFSDLAPGTYTLEATYLGSDANETASVTVPATGVVTADFRLGTTLEDDVIIIVGQLATQTSALARKRAADGVSSVLTRDAIGQFPDQNVAESIRRLPGINVLNDQGEGRFVAVRGLDPNLNSTSVNGVRVPSPESDIRAVALDVISSELIESIEVKKSLTPDMDADTIGAAIEINTTSAFDRTDDLFAVKAEGSYNDLRDEWTPRVGAEFAMRLTDDLGIAGGVSYDQRKFSTDNVEAEDWAVTDDGALYPEAIEFRDYDVERERFTATLNVDMRLTPGTELYVRGLYSQFDDQEYRRRLIFGFDEEPSGTGTTVTFSDADGEIGVERDVKDRFESQRVRTLSVGGETIEGPWTLEYQASWALSSENEDGSVDPTTFAQDFDNNGFAATFDFSDRVPAFSVDSGAGLFFDPARYELDEVELTDRSDAQDEEFALQLDVGRTFATGGGDFTVQAGYKGRWRQKRFDGEIRLYDGFDGTYTLANVVGDPSYRLAGLSPVPSFSGAADFFFANRDRFELADVDSQFDSAVEDYTNDEDIQAGYALGRWESTSLRVIGGVRVEHTENEISGNTVELIEEGTPDGEDLVVVTPNELERSYTDWLPSLNVRYTPVDRLVLRAAGYKSLVRPNLAYLAPRFAIEESSDEEREGEFGNPDLLPNEAWNADISAEWYFATSSALTANAFYKDISNYLVFREYDADDAPFFGSYNGVTFDEAVIPENGDSAEVFGAEFGYAQAFTMLPAPFDGLLLNVNYTYTDASGTLADGREIRLPATSEHTANAVIGYEKGPLSIRVAATYRDLYLDEVGGGADEDRYVADHLQLDGSVKLFVTDNIQIFGEWVNITDEPYFAYQNFEGGRRLLQYEEYSYTANFGVRATF